jgi:hypothetical protein
MSPGVLLQVTSLNPAGAAATGHDATAILGFLAFSSLFGLLTVIYLCYAPRLLARSICLILRLGPLRGSGREVTLESFAFAPFSGGVHFKRLVITDADARTSVGRWPFWEKNKTPIFKKQKKKKKKKKKKRATIQAHTKVITATCIHLFFSPFPPLTLPQPNTHHHHSRGSNRAALVAAAVP